MIRRRLFNIASVVSLLLCVATIVAWARSYYFLDVIRVLQWHSLGVESLAGSGAIHWTPDNARDGGWVSPPGMHVSIKGKSYLENGFQPEAAKWHAAGFGYLSVDIPFDSGQVIKTRGLIVPYCFSAGCAAVLPAIWLIARMRNRSKPLVGRCAACNYDLTGNTSGVCPECGTPVPSKPETAA